MHGGGKMMNEAYQIPHGECRKTIPAGHFPVLYMNDDPTS
jgi:hypothetical protein